MAEKGLVVKISGKDEFLADVAEEKEALVDLKNTADEAYESIQRLNEQLDKLKNR
jgi:hypothetical protein